MISHEPTTCPSCQHSSTVKIGPIPGGSSFAGTAQAKLRADSFLFKCKHCDLFFKIPQLSAEHMATIYTAAPATNWAMPAGSRRDWQMASTWITASMEPGASILDIGCYDGRFLSSLPNAFKLFGIELNSSAQQIARGKGVTIAGNNIETLTWPMHKFDCITAFDVAEHMRNPALLLHCIGSMLKTNGIAVLSSGNINAPSRKFMGSQYWYCAIGEHISFISPDWCKKHAPSYGLVVEEIRKYRHQSVKPLEFMFQAAKNVSYRCLPGLFLRFRRRKALISGPQLQHNNKTPPPWTAASDHFITLLKRHTAEQIE